MNSLPIIAVPTGLANTNTGQWIYDALPLVTMAACVPTLFLYYRSKRWTDLVSSSKSSLVSIVFVSLDGVVVCPTFQSCALSKCGLICMQAVFSLGFALASVYHICHMHDEGLHKSEVFGISGPLWRTWDILCAQWLLARTFGHAVGARHWVTQGESSLMLFCTCFAESAHTQPGSTVCHNTLQAGTCHYHCCKLCLLQV